MARHQQPALMAFAAVLLMAASSQARELLQGSAAASGAAAAGDGGAAAGSSAAAGSGTGTAASSATAAVDAGQATGSAASAAGTAAGAQPGTPSYPPNFWWGTPKDLYNDPKYSYQVYKQGDQYYYKPLSAKTPYYWVVKYYGGTAGPLYLSRSKGSGKELGMVSPKGPDGATYGYYFDSTYSGKYYINDYYPYDTGFYYYQPPYNRYLEVNFP